MCSIDDVVMYEDVTNILSVDADGYITGQIDHTDGDFRSYHCEGCGEDFGEGTYDMNKSWQLVKEHLSEKN